MTRYSLGEGPYGSAYRGDINDILASGDLTPIEFRGRTFGLFLGRFDWQWTVRHTWKEAKRGLWAWLTRSSVSRTKDETIGQTHDFRFTGDQHHLLVAGTGAGKFRDALSNMLLYDGSCETSCLIIDPKGEIASKVGPIIDQPDTSDQRTLILDPWNVCGTGTTEAITFLEGLTPDNPHCVKDARILADAIIVHRQGDGGHWDATAKNFLTALLLYLATDPIEEDTRHLRRLRELVTLPWTVPEGSGREYLNGLLEYLTGSTMFGGIVARSVQAFLNREQKERSYILSTIERDTEFVEDPSLWKSLEKTSVDMRQLVVSNKRLHVILPFDYITPMRSWLRLAIASYYNACLRNSLPDSFPNYLKFRHIIIDEFPSLGKLDFMVRDIAEARGAGIKHHLIVQSFSQLKGLYGEIWENFASNSFIQAFGISDLFTSEYLSKLTGQSTVVTETKAIGVTNTETRGTTSSSGSSGSGFGSATTTSRSTGTNNSVSVANSVTNTFATTGRPVLTADEVRRMSNKQQLLFIRDLPVLMAQRAPYYETFRDFLPRHTLKELPFFKMRLAARESGKSVPFSCNPLSLLPQAKQKSSNRAVVNSRFHNSDFDPPQYRPQRLFEAIISDALPICIIAALFLGFHLLRSKWANDARVEADRQAAMQAALEKQREEAAAKQKIIDAENEKNRQIRLAHMIARPPFTLAPQKASYNPDWCRYLKSLIEANKPYCTQSYARQEGVFMSYLTTRAYVFCNRQETSIQVEHPSNYTSTLQTVQMMNQIFSYDSNARTYVTSDPARMSSLIDSLIENGMAYPHQLTSINNTTRSLYGAGCPFGSIDEDRYYPPPNTPDAD